MRLALATILFLPFVAFGVIIPPDRIYPWQGNVGIPGGIPVRNTIFANVKNSPYNAVGDGVHDDTSAIQSACNACPSNQVVYIPTSTYYTSARIYLPKGGTVRGDGPGKTVISGHGTSGSVFAFGGDGNNYEQYEFNGNRNVANISSGATLGSSNIVVSSATGIVVGTLLNLDEINDTNGYLQCVSVGNEGSSGNGSRSQDGAGTRTLGQVCYVTAVSGTSITVDPPIGWWYTNVYSSQVPQTTQFPISNAWAGLESMTITNNNTGQEQSVSMWSVAFCWMTNVESTCSDGDHVIIDSSARVYIGGCYFHDSWVHASGSHDSTIVLRNHSSGYLVENNIMRRLHIGIIIETGAGVGAITYNFMTNQFDSGSQNAMYNDIEYHGSHPLMVLYEGNVINSFNQDGVWGTATSGTCLRNFVSGQDWDCPPYTGTPLPEQTGSYNKQYQGNRCMNLSGIGQSLYFNFVGNVFGTTNMGNYPSFNPVYTNIWAMVRQYDHEGLILSMGYAGGGDDGTQTGFLYGTQNNQPWTTLINHGNWDVVNKQVIWSNNIADHVIPNSYYLTSKPAFMGTLNYPPIDPLTATNDNTYQITNVAAVRTYFGLPINFSTATGQQWSGGTQSGFNLK